MIRNRRARAAAFVMSLFVVAGLGAIAAPPAGAASEPTLYEPRPTNSWGVDGLDPGSGNFQYYSLVFALAQIGDTVYSGGKFLETTNGATVVDQPYLTALSADGDAWRSNFRPDIDWSVFALETSASGSRLFVGGEFPSANGDTSQAGFVALDPDTGETDTSFGVQISRVGGAQPRVHALHREGEWLYIAGHFSQITGSNGRTYWRNNVARVNAETGVVDGDWRPRVDGRAVWEVAPDPANDRVLLGGLFKRIEGQDTAAFGIVDDTTGALLDTYDRSFGITYFHIAATNYDFAMEIEVADDRIALGGQDHRILITDSDLNIISSHRTDRYGAFNGGRGGDTQDILISDGVVFVGCHCFGQARNEATGELFDVRAAYAVDLETGEYLEWFQPDFGGQSGAWAFLIDDEQCLWIGSDSPQVGQATGRGVSRLCPNTNLAWDAGTTISANPVNGSRPADGAIDADLITNLSATHLGAGTAMADRPYFDLALAAQADIDNVILWAPTNGLSGRFRDITVWVSDEPITGTSYAELRADPNVQEISRPGDHALKRTLTFPVGERARYVRVQADYVGAGLAFPALVLSEIAITGSLAPAGPAPDSPPEACAVTVEGTVATVTWTGAGSNDQIIYRSVNGSANYWRGRTGESSFADQLRNGAEHVYSVTTVGAGFDDAVTCSPDPVVVGGVAEPVELTSTYQNRSRIVLRWTPRTAVTISRDGVEIAAEDDGWFTDTGLEAGTSYTYTVTTPDGATATVVAATQP